MGKIVTLDQTKKRGGPIVKVCIPYYESLPDSTVLLIEQLMRGIPGYEVHILKKRGTIITFLRNELAMEPAGLDYDFIFFLDADVGYEHYFMQVPDPSDNRIAVVIGHMKQVLDHDLNICAGIYPGRKPPHLPMAFYKLPDDSYVHITNPPESGLSEVDAVGTGFICIKKKVIDSLFLREELFVRKATSARDSIKFLMEKYLGEKEDAENIDNDTMHILKKHLQNIQEGLNYMKPNSAPPFWFDRVWNPTKKRFENIGEDIHFCREAQKEGYHIYVDWAVDLGHQSAYYATIGNYRHAYKKEAHERNVKELQALGFPYPTPIEKRIIVNKKEDIDHALINS